MAKPGDLIFVCSRLRAVEGSWWRSRENNVERARRFACLVAIHGFIPWVPHLMLTTFLDDDIPEERELGITLGEAMLPRCAELWEFTPPGDVISDGMARDLRAATAAGIPIVHVDPGDVADLAHGTMPHLWTLPAMDRPKP